MGWQNCFSLRELFYILSFTLLSLLLPLSFLLLSRLSGAQYYLQTLPYSYPTQQVIPLSFLTSLFSYTTPILYLVVSILSITTLLHGLTGKIALLSIESRSPVLRPRLYFSWIFLCTIQVCVGLGLEGSIVAGLFDEDCEECGYGNAGSTLLISRVIFLLGLNETMLVWCRVGVKPVVDDTVIGFEREERWIEKVVMTGSLGLLWWWKLRDEVETLVVMAGVKREQLMMEVGLADFIGWWLYYLTVTIGMVRIVKGLMWIGMVLLCRRTRRRVEEVEVENGENDDKV